MKDWHREFAMVVLMVCLIGTFIIGISINAGFEQRQQVKEFCPNYTTETHLTGSIFLCEGKEFKCSGEFENCWYVEVGK